MLASLFTALLQAIAAVAPSVAAALGHKPVPEPPQPHAGGWAGIEGEEDAAVAARRAAKPQTVGGQTK